MALTWGSDSASSARNATVLSFALRRPQPLHLVLLPLLLFTASLHLDFPIPARSMGSRKRAKPNPTPQQLVDNSTVDPELPPLGDAGTPGSSLVVSDGGAPLAGQVSAGGIVDAPAVGPETDHSICTRELTKPIIVNAELVCWDVAQDFEVCSRHTSCA
jgi:hypothetical protein